MSRRSWTHRTRRLFPLAALAILPVSPYATATPSIDQSAGSSEADAARAIRAAPLQEAPALRHPPEPPKVCSMSPPHAIPSVELVAIEWSRPAILEGGAEPRPAEPVYAMPDRREGFVAPTLRYQPWPAPPAVEPLWLAPAPVLAHEPHEPGIGPAEVPAETFGRVTLDARRWPAPEVSRPDATRACIPA